MAEIIETQKLPVTITKVKIGKKDLTKKIIDQLPFEWYIYCKHKDGSQEWGLPFIVSENPGELIFDRDKPYIVDGTLLGYINPIWNDETNLSDYLRGVGEFNNAGKWFLIVWYTNDGKLRKGYLDSWTIMQLGIELDQIFI